MGPGRGGRGRHWPLFKETAVQPPGGMSCHAPAVAAHLVACCHQGRRTSPAANESQAHPGRCLQGWGPVEGLLAVARRPPPRVPPSALDSGGPNRTNATHLKHVGFAFCLCAFVRPAAAAPTAPRCSQPGRLAALRGAVVRYS